MNNKLIIVYCEGKKMTGVYVEPYTDKSFVVFSDNPEDLKNIKEELKGFGGRWNPSLTKAPGKGWIFSNKYWDSVIEYMTPIFGSDLQILENPEIPTPAPSSAQPVRGRTTSGQRGVRAAAPLPPSSRVSPTVSQPAMTRAPVARTAVARPAFRAARQPPPPAPPPAFNPQTILYSDIDGNSYTGQVLEVVDPDTIIADINGQEVEIKKIWQIVGAETPHEIILE